ncbi:MAG: beta-galactosidase GalB, partial [Tepidisphaeraceae bacterium]
TLAAHAAIADELPRERVSLDDGWHFQKGEPQGLEDQLGYGVLKPWLLPTTNAMIDGPAHARPSGAAPGEAIDLAQPGFDDSQWRTLNLPHDWGIEGPFDQNLPGETGKLPWQGVAWYRKTFDLPATDAGRRIRLDVDGAMSYASVWCNGKFVGGWPYGYASWQVDLTPFVKAGASNTLAIRLDNPRESSRWYPGGGLYRNVWLEKTSPVHVGQWGTFITTPQVSEASAEISIKTELVNDSSTDASVNVQTVLYARDAAGKIVGNPVATLPAMTVALPASGRQTIQQTQSLANPRLWDTQNPNLYAAVTTVQQDGKAVDRYESSFGVRQIQFTADDGLHVNGKRVRIQGVCLHHDLGALGAAFNVRAAERQLQIMKEMGVNAIRCSHNPPAPEMLDLCDRMGLLVMDELTDTWTVPKKPNGYAKLFADWSEPDLRAMIRRDRNHPSVIIWSIGNEIGEQRRPEMHPVAARLSGIVHEEDTSRPTAAACDQPASGFNGFNKTIDLFGYNYKPMLYGKFREQNPDQPLFGSETASTISTRGEYLFPVSNNKGDGKIGFQMSSYDLYAPGWASSPDAEFKGQDQFPFVAGEFVWTGFDYIGEPTPFNRDTTVLTNFHTPEAKAKAEQELKELGKIQVPSRSSYFGIVDLAGFKKDRFYLYQARWRPDYPMAHLLPHWNWPERVGEVTPVHVYTSGDEAELFLNGNSLGRKKKGPL